MTLFFIYFLLFLRVNYVKCYVRHAYLCMQSHVCYACNIVSRLRYAKNSYDSKAQCLPWRPWPTQFRSVLLLLRRSFFFYFRLFFFLLIYIKAFR